MPDADVYQGSTLVAHLERTLSGTRLSFVEGGQLERGFLATTLPFQTWEGADLPSFFLNLLPEGARLKLLLESSRAKDDLLGLLLTVGWDTIGDIAVLPRGESPGKHHTTLASRLPESSFWDLFFEGISDRPDSSIPGAQEKISASTVAFGVRTSAVPSAILKLNPPKFPRLVENEEFFLRMAKACGIQVNRAVIVHDRHGEAGLLVTRFDRVKKGKAVIKLHQEDACQLLDSAPANKYEVSIRQIADAVTGVCAAPLVEMERFIRLIAFSYLIGNCDLHAKNVSVLWDDATRLSPGYDLLSTLPYAFLDSRMALKLQGKDDNFKTGDFIEFGRRYGLPEKAVGRSVQDLCDRAEPWIERTEEIGFGSRETASLRKELGDRLRRLRS